MHELKSITKEGITRALEKVERYRLLNEPAEAESICRDVLSLEPDNQTALVMFILSLSDQFGSGMGDNEVRESLAKLTDEYQKAYYSGIVSERQAKAAIIRGGFGSSFDAYEWMEEAMESFEKAAKLRPSGNDDPILRYNACVRAIQRHHLTERAKEGREPMLE